MQKVQYSRTRECCRVEKHWCLEGFFLTNGMPVRVSLSALPIKMGRGNAVQVAINQPSISRFHAEIGHDRGCITIRDMGSRNGTFVNHQRIEKPTVLYSGDFVHLGSCEFRVIKENETFDENRQADETWLVKEPGRREFQGLIDDKAILSCFQPVVYLDTSQVFAFESLGRGNHPGAPEMPEELFRLAKRFGYSQTLSSLFRGHALEEADKMPSCYQIFVNIHPDEMAEPDNFLGEMASIRDIYPNLNLVVEVPENLIIESGAVSEIHKGLQEMGYGLAYDDFGTGQSRLMQLADCPPDYLKFDRSLIASLETAPYQRQKMVEVLVKYANEIGVITVAEGIETPEESDMCRQLGFRCGQGYLFGKPMLPKEAMERERA